MSAVIVFIVGLVLIAATYLFWFYMQPFKAYQVDISQKQIQKRKILYKQYKGSYADIKDMFDKLLEMLEKMGPLSGFKKPLGDVIEECFGVYYDNPDKMQDETESKAVYGLVIPPITSDFTAENEKELIRVFSSKYKYSVGSLPESEGLHGRLPNEEYYFYVLRNLEFQPVMKGDVQELRSWYQRYQEHQEKGEGCQLEIYDKDSIHFYLPLKNLSLFDVLCDKTTLPKSSQPNINKSQDTTQSSTSGVKKQVKVISDQEKVLNQQRQNLYQEQLLQNKQSQQQQTDNTSQGGVNGDWNIISNKSGRKGSKEINKKNVNNDHFEKIIELDDDSDEHIKEESKKLK